MAAGALLAGAAIPIAAAGTAWADDSSDNAGSTTPAIPIAAASPASVAAPTGIVLQATRRHRRRNNDS